LEVFTMIEKRNRAFKASMRVRVGAIVAASATGLLFAACGGSDGSSLINGTPDDASSSGDVLANDDGSTTINDSGNTTSDANVITDGGANFGDAGGDNDGGDFPDGGSCNRTDMGPSIMSDCTAIPPFLNGGQIQNGTYVLTKVSDVGSFTFCNNTFAAVPFQGGLVVSSGPDNSSNFELALDGDMTGRKSYSWTATPAKGNKSPLGIEQSCPSTATFSLPYNIVTSSALNKQAIEIEAPYGTAGANAVYHFEKS
jgi:hypothetical protein